MGSKILFFFSLEMKTCLLKKKAQQTITCLVSKSEYWLEAFGETVGFDVKRKFEN